MSEERQRAIETLKEHLAHWERLLKEHICDETEGKNTIEAFKMSISSLETDEAYQLEYEQLEFCKDCISRSHLLSEIAKLKKSPWFNRGKNSQEYGQSIGYSERKEAVGMVENLCIKKEPSVLPKLDVPDNNVGKIESTTKNDLAVDCISRKGARNVLMNCDSLQIPELTEAIKAIDKLPSVLPKANKPKERWILKNVDTSVLKIACPICGFKRNVLKETLSKFNYCPNCGADLREETE